MLSVSVSTDEEDTLRESVDPDARRCACSDDTESCCRLTAAEELRGHLLDCFSLYGCRFEHSAVTLACIQPLLRSSSSSARHGSAPRISSVVEAEEKELCSAGSAFDVSTVATVLFVHAGATSGAFGGAAGERDSGGTVSLLGVVVSFHYWRGFRCVAERRYSSAAEAQGEAEALESAHLTVSEVLKTPPWRLIGEPVAEESSSATPSNSHADLPTSLGSTDMAPRFAGGERNTAAARGDAYESLMTLMVSIYL
ncbi:hypothetical protein GH5_06454 [Leishmania sp. Ghana 2012 LV757]|uniref:hypothetical protein n=1 Tax=Leishmania sp. Ghana 2012 LV757 TaxID=2803181 RepID=UPI001B6D9A2F|nr:hypothetical protein GH5_06454 [Leishmania sp. Ghana 2012 LV757]